MIKRLLCLFAFSVVFSPAVFGQTMLAVSSGITGVYLGDLAWGDVDNDGYLDLAVTGETDTGARITRIYHNNGNQTFSLFGELPGGSFGSIAFGDYNNDGYLDLVISGENPDDIGFTTIYRNDAGTTFTAIAAGLPGRYYSDVTFGDWNNDGRQDVLLHGYMWAASTITRVFRNNGDGTFTDIPTGLPDCGYGTAAMADYDKDGWLDVLLQGFASNYTQGVFHNNGGTVSPAQSLPIGMWGAGTWGDFNGDGRLDFALGYNDPSYGRQGSAWIQGSNGTFPNSYWIGGCQFGSADSGDYDNDGNDELLVSGWGSYADQQQIKRFTGYSFTDLYTGLPGAGNSASRFGDFNNDGRLDVAFCGLSGGVGTTAIYRSAVTTVNTRPTTPTNLRVGWSGDAANLIWDAATDAQTPSVALSYNVRMGTTPGGVDMISPLSDPITGFVKVSKPGNANQRLFQLIRGIQPRRTYYWSVQAVDSGRMGSPFAPEQSVVFDPDVQVQPSACDFGEMFIDAGSTGPLSLAVFNAGNMALEFTTGTVTILGPDADEFAFSQPPDVSPIMPGASRTISISFDPQRVGVANATVEIHTTDADSPVVTAPLTGLGKKRDIEVTPLAVDFGARDIDDGPSPSRQIAISNVSGTPRNFVGAGIQIIGSNASEFQFASLPSTAALDGGTTRIVSVVLDASTTGPKTATLRITTDDSDEPVYDVALTAVCTDQEVTVSPGSVDFGSRDIDVGQTALQTITVRNDGNSTLNFLEAGAILTGPNASEFAFSPGSTTSPLAAGTTRSFFVAFDPSTTGTKTAYAVFHVDDTDEPYTTVTLTGVGVDQEITIIGGPLNFGSWDVDAGGTTSQSVVIRNDGNGPLSFVSPYITITGTNSSEFFFVSTPSRTDLAPGASRTVSIYFNPAAAGAKTASLRIRSNDTDEPDLYIPLSATGIDQEITVLGSPLNFGSTDIDAGQSSPLSVTIRNDGSAPLNYTGAGIQIVGTNPSDFAFVSAPPILPLGPGASQTVSLRFHPGALGTRSATLRITTDDTDESTVDVAMSGVGVDQEITVINGPLDFGSIDIDAGLTSPLSITIRNDGTGPLNFTGPGIQIAGPNAADFVFAPTPLLTPLSAGASRTVTLNFNPIAVGPRQANLFITSDDTDESTVAIPLSGIGLDQEITVTPLGPIDFGFRNIGAGPSTPTQITIRNDGTAPLNFTTSGVVITGANASEFQFNGTPDVTPVNPATDRIVGVRFSPVTIGSKAATVVIHTDDTDEPAVSISLTGRGLDPFSAATDWQLLQ